jgi:type IV pilus assembly protein PilM
MRSFRAPQVGSTSVIGLDIGSSAVRATEVTRTRRGVIVQKFAQVGLPEGWVADGEIREPGLVATALRRLWAEGGFGSRNVVLGLSGQRVIVRQAEVPVMPESDFRSALKFQAMDLIPIPVDDALLDFVLVPDRATRDTMQILLAAAPRAVVDAHLAVLREASLTAVAIDPAPVAMIRATHNIVDESGGNLALVDIGAESTTIVVREDGRLCFSRTLKSGGGDLTKRLAAREDVTFPEAEGLKRADAPGQLLEDVDPLITEIEGSLSFFAAQLGEGSIPLVLLAGGASKGVNLTQELARRLPASVTAIDALGGLDDVNLDISIQGRSAAALRGLVAIGAAQWSFDQPTRRLSLLPREYAAAAARRRQVAAVVAGAVVLVAGLTAMTLHKQHERTTVERQTAVIQRTSDLTQIRVSKLAPVRALGTALDERQELLAQDSSNNIAWSTLLAEITAAMPPGTTLSNLTLSDGVEASSTVGASPPAASSGSNAAETGALGSVSMSVVGRGTEEQVAVWLRAIRKVHGLESVWVPSASATGGKVTFTSSAGLTTGVPLVLRPEAETSGS